MTEPARYVPDGAQLRAFYASNAFLRALVGPVYGGRKTCVVNDIVRRATDRRYSRQGLWRWLVARPTRRGLERDTIPCLKAWLPRGKGEWSPSGRGYALKYRLADGVVRRLEIECLGLDDPADRRRLAAGGASAVWLDDARNLSEAVLEDAIRAAGSEVGGGRLVWSGVVCSSRMPAPGHWLLRRPEDPGDLALFRQPGGRAPAAENLAVLKQRGFAYDELAVERDPDWVRVEIDAEIGFSASDQAREAERHAARSSLSRWTGTAMPEIAPARHHQLLIDHLEALERGDIARLMFFLPPGSAKSTYGSVLFPSWYMGRNPAHNVIAASHSKELAERFGRRVRNIAASETFRDTFGFGLSAGSAAAGRFETARGGEYFAVGVDGSVTGRRCHLGLIDDPIKGRAEADSATVRQHAWEWYKSDFWTRLVPGAKLLYIGTRWHDDDLAGRLLEDAKSGGEQWRVVSVPAIAIEGREDPLGRMPGERLWPEWFTAEMFEQAQRDPRNWSALYQQEPMPETGEYFKSEWLRWYDTAPPREQLRTYGASDYAVSAAAGDFTVHLVAGIDPADDIYLLDLWRERTASDAWAEALIDLMARWKTLTWAEERGQIEKGVGPFLTKRQLERKVYAARRQFTSAHDKATRAQAIRGRMAMGKVLLPRRAPWTTDLVNELLRFPAGRNDDMVDSLSLIGRMLDELIPGSKPRAVEPIRGAERMTWDECIRLTGPGGRFGYPLGGRLQARI